MVVEKLELVLHNKGLFKEELTSDEVKLLVQEVEQRAYHFNRHKEHNRAKVLQENNIVKLAAIYAPYGLFQDPKKEDQLHKNPLEMRHIYNALKKEGFLVVEDDRPIFKAEKAKKDGKHRLLRDGELPHDIVLNKEISEQYPTLRKIAFLSREVRSILDGMEKLHLFTDQPTGSLLTWYRQIAKLEKSLPDEISATVGDLYLATIASDGYGNLKYWIKKWPRPEPIRIPKTQEEIEREESWKRSREKEHGPIKERKDPPTLYNNISEKELMEEWIQFKKEFPILKIPM